GGIAHGTTESNAGGADHGVVFGVEPGERIRAQPTRGGGEALGAIDTRQGGGDAQAESGAVGLGGGALGFGGTGFGAGVTAAAERDVGHERETEGVFVAHGATLLFETNTDGGHRAGGGPGHLHHRIRLGGAGGGELECGGVLG